MITNTSTAAKHVFGYMTRKTVPPFADRHRIERYINDLRLELDWAQQTLEACEKNQKRKSPCKSSSTAPKK